MITLIDTIDMMKSEDFKERFKAEYFQLNARIEGLGSMLKHMKKETLPFTPKCSYDILEEQYDIMVSYLDILRERAEIEDINITL